MTTTFSTPTAPGASSPSIDSADVHAVELAHAQTHTLSGVEP